MIPNRISFFLGLVGHSIHIDNACISSASALEFAYRYMKEGICDAAIVGGSIVTLHPHLSYHFNKIGKTMCNYNFSLIFTSISLKIIYLIMFYK
jgi:fatty acid synthase